MTAVAQSEIAAYVEAVRAALADLPPQARDDLLEDLPEHLAEVAAEGDGSLTDRLGPPAAYAAELRASSGAGGTGEYERETFVGNLRAMGGEVRRRLRQADVQIGPVIGYGSVSEFLRLLRPAWWVLRGYLAAMVVTYLSDSSGPEGLVPRLGGDELGGMLMLVAFVVGSIWLGRRSAGLARWPRRLVLGGSAVLVLFSVAMFAEIDGRARNAYYETYPVADTPYQDISDVFVFDVDGRLIEGAYLIDRNGQPIVLGYDDCSTASEAPQLPPPPGFYPRCLANAPWTQLPGRATAPPAPTPPAPSPAAPTPGGTPAATPTPPGSPAATPTPVPSPTG